MVFPLRAYVKSEKKRELLGFKPYFVDNGLLAVLGVRDWSRLLENLVFTELLKRGLEPNRDLFYYVTQEAGRWTSYSPPGRSLFRSRGSSTPPETRSVSSPPH